MVAWLSTVAAAIVITAIAVFLIYSSKFLAASLHSVRDDMHTTHILESSHAIT